MRNDETMTKPEARKPVCARLRYLPFELPSSFVIRSSSLFLRVNEREHQFCFGHHRVINDAVALRFRQPVAPRLGQLGLNEQRVSRKYRLSEFHAVGTHEIANAMRRLRQLKQ